MFIHICAHVYIYVCIYIHVMPCNHEYITNRVCVYEQKEREREVYICACLESGQNTYAVAPYMLLGPTSVYAIHLCVLWTPCKAPAHFVW